MDGFKKAIIVKAAAFKPNELVKKSNVSPKKKLIIKKEIRLILTGKIKIKTTETYGSYIPNKSNLLKTNP
jgi:hypothetical protein|tara:strand:- start:440 stop:649 length:210 start_codon:yes stop_codon:yes gene_type:complete